MFLRRSRGNILINIFSDRHYGGNEPHIDIISHFMKKWNSFMIKIQILNITLSNIIQRINDVLWGEAVILLIFAAWIFLSVKCGFPQIKLFSLFKTAFKGLKNGKTKGISPSRAVSAALAASMGTGNIAGVAAALGTGGSGAVLWMMIAAFFGMACAYTENCLGSENSEKQSKNSIPPMSYIAKIPFGKYLSAVYACACVAASFFMGNMIQGSALCRSAESLTGGNICLISAAAAVLIGTVIAGGKNRITYAAERIIPAASALYILSAAAVIFIFRDRLGDVIGGIFRSAFGIKAAGGGVIGYTVRSAVSTGMRRGIFSNEAGLGSSVLVHSSSECSDPHTVGCWAACEVFIDTVICCTLTALALLVTGTDCTADETDALVYAFSAALGNFGRYLVPVSMILFAGASVLGWCCCGETALHSITGKESGPVTVIYRAAHIILLFVGGITEMSLLWGAADIVNWIMLIINLTAVVLLYGTAAERKER